MPVAPRIDSLGTYDSGRVAIATVKRIFHVVNFPLLLSSALLTAYGLLIVYSATLDSADFSYNRQLLGVVMGAALLLVLWRLDYHRLEEWVIPLIVFDLLLILSPLFPIIGVEVNGARSWISFFGQQIQPSEPAKILTIVILAALVSKYRGKLNSGKEYLKCLGVLLILLMAIMMQPDLGTGMVFFAIAISILLAGGAHWKWLLLTLMAIAAVIALMIYIDPILDKAAGRDVLIKDYQMNRLLVFMDENLDPTGAGYHLKQAKIAIGSGGLLGKGLHNGTQAVLGFLPEAPTDFIFCVLAEELGFLGCIVLLALYGGLIISSFWVAFKADDPFGTLIIMGCVGMWVFQILENIGMTCGLMPITGIPLPFVSYGSSFMLTNFMAVGMILSVWTHRSVKKGRGDR